MGRLQLPFVPGKLGFAKATGKLWHPTQGSETFVTVEWERRLPGGGISEGPCLGVSPPVQPPLPPQYEGTPEGLLGPV